MSPVDAALDKLTRLLIHRRLVDALKVALDEYFEAKLDEREAANERRRLDREEY